MKRLLLNLTLVFFGSTLLLGSYLWTNRTFITAGHLSTSFQLPVTIEDMEIHSDQIVLHQVAISNLPGSELERAFHADRIVIRFQPWELLTPIVHISQVEIENPTLGIEMYESGGSDNNWELILNRAQAQKSDSGRRFEIRHLVATHIRIKAYNRSLSRKVLQPRPIPHFEAWNIGTEHPLDKTQLVAMVTQAIMSEAVQLPGMSNILDDVRQAPTELFKGIFSLPRRTKTNTK